MNNQNADDSSSYTNVLASLTQDNENCLDGSLHPHPLVSESSFASDLVGMEELAIVTSNGQVSGRLASRIMSGDLNNISNSKPIDIDPEDLLQQNCHIEDPTISFKTNSMILQSKSSKWKEVTDEFHISKKINIYPKLDDTSQSQSISNSSNTEDNMINLSVNKLPLQSTNNTAVEQPNVGPCSCFICGQVLVDPGERFSYMKSQKLFSMKIPLLQLLSDIVNQTVITNTDSIDLCPKCSELMNEVDITYKHLNDLKEEITKSFTMNKRPKLTFHILSKPSMQIPKNYLLKKPKEVNLSELAYTRPRRGRGSKTKSVNKDKVNQLMENEKPVKRKGGRPRKPFQCHICRRKFLTQGMRDKHQIKEHNIVPTNSPTSILRPINSSSVESSANLNSDKKVKEEKMEEERDMNDKCESEKKPHLLSILQNSSSFPPFSKFSLMETFNPGLQSTMRPIQPKPQTVVQTAVDGSLMFYMNPTTSESSPTLIKVSPGYLNLKTGGHTCELCQKTFLDDKGYKMHKIAAHGVRKRKIEYEGMNNGNTFVNEDKKDAIQKLWQCDLCNLVFSSKKYLSDHKKLSHESSFKGVISKDSRKEKMYSCEDCEQMFNYKYEMESHRESHLPFNQVGPHEFVCCLCGLKVASKAALKIHLHRFHSKEEETKDFLCAECGYMTGTKKAFSDHLRVHNDNPGQKKECHLCQKEMLPSSYKIHMLRMHGEAKYPCDTCGQRFTVRSDLMKHLNTIHSSLRPYDCVLCREKFVTSEALRYHKNKIHSTVFHFCEICGKSYKWKGELRTHMNRCHNEPRTRYQCTQCSRSYADRRKLYHHMVNKHNTPKEVACIRRPCTETVTQVKKDVGEIVSSGYEPQGTLISSPQTVVASIPCSSTHQNVQLVTGQENLNALHGYNHNQQTTLTTLHSHIPLQHTDHDLQRPLSHHTDNTITHFHNSQIQVSTSHNILPHQNLNSTLVPLQPKVQQLTQQEVQSIYLVSDMHMTIPDKSVSTS